MMRVRESNERDGFFNCSLELRYEMMKDEEDMPSSWNYLHWAMSSMGEVEVVVV
jgi:hypothetical protein